MKLTRQLLLSLLLIPGAAAATASDDDVAPACKAQLIPHPYPPRSINQKHVGFNGSGYHEVDLVQPRPVPLAIEASDTDRMLVYCNGVCVQQTMYAESRVDWELPSDGSGGAFVNAAADELTSYPNATCCLYLPPSDLEIGDTRDAMIKATVREICSYAADHDTIVWFKAEVVRIDEARWDVSVAFDHIDSAGMSSPPCPAGSPSPCQLLGPAVSTQPLVSASIVEYPSNGMVLGELRPIRCDAFDLDRMMMECGMPQHDPPISNFAQQDKCDDMNYQWSIVSGPGSGSFVYADQAVLFRATQPGDVTVRVDVTTSDNEHVWAEATFNIAPPRIKALTLKNNITLVCERSAIGGAGQPYAPAYWLDNNDNLVADDAPPAGDRNFPVAYRVNSKVEFDWIVLMPGLGGAAPKPMPGTVIKGVSQLAPAATFTGPATWNAAMLEWNCSPITTIGQLGPAVAIHDYGVDWKLDFGGGVEVALNPTRHRIYVVLGGLPIALPDAYLESVFEVACAPALGATTPAAAASAIWAYFATRNVSRVTKNGFNETFPAGAMRYWGGANPPSVVGGLLNQGDGKCGAWTELLAFALRHQGVESSLRGLVPAPGGLGANGRVLVRDFNTPAATPNGPWPFAQLVRAPQSPPVLAQGETAALRPSRAEWQDHAVVEIPASVFGFRIVVDPSYGEGPFIGANAYIDLENKILLGVSRNWNTGQTVEKQNPATADLVIE